MSKTAEEMALEINGKIDGFKSELANASTKEELQKVQDALEAFKSEGLNGLVKAEALTKLENIIKEQGEELTKLKEEGAQKVAITLEKEVKDNKEVIKSISKGTNKEVVLKANTVRASVTSNTQAYQLPDIGQLAHKKLSMYDIFPKYPVSESNNNGVIKYWDWDQATIARAAAAVAEGAAFPASTAKWVEGTVALKKLGDTLPVSEEFEEDEAMFAAELGQFLSTNVELVIDEDLANADGTANKITGLVSSVNAYTPVVSGITDASLFDLLVKVSESITASGGSKYAPDFAVMNIVDINKMKLKKDTNNNYVIPPFVSQDGSRVGAITVIESNVITANSMVVGDRRYGRIYEKGGIVLSKGQINAQFTEDMMTLKVRKRLAFLIRGADKGGFAKVTSISAALTTLAT